MPKPTFLTISGSNRQSISTFRDIASKDSKKLILFFVKTAGSEIEFLFEGSILTPFKSGNRKS
jgi:hypothetical protein